MRHAFWALAAVVLIGSSGGCNIYHKVRHQAACSGAACRDGACHDPAGHNQCACGGRGCEACRDGHPNPHEPFYHGHQGPPERGGVLSALHGLGGHGGGGPPAGAQPAPGPSAAQVSYPYYTTRGPRDFLAPNPRGIGP